MFISDGTKSELRWQLSGVRLELGGRKEGERERERERERESFSMGDVLTEVGVKKRYQDYFGGNNLIAFVSSFSVSFVIE